ncbi:hypothetical protein TNCV_2578601 [Trichonephila clavipes]|nr:hypothetical protein TNCV_2578601 [Trichonephila clavipes]
MNTCNCLQVEICRIHIKFVVKLKISNTKTFQILTEDYGEEILSRAHVREWYKRFQREGSVWKMVNQQVKSRLKRTHSTSFEEVQAKTENSPKGPLKSLVPELLPAMTAPNAEVCEC